MRISRTILSLILAAAAIILKYFGVDIDLTSPEVGEAGWTLMEFIAWALGILAWYFRTVATVKTTTLGIKTDTPLG